MGGRAGGRRVILHGRRIAAVAGLVRRIALEGATSGLYPGSCADAGSVLLTALLFRAPRAGGAAGGGRVVLDGGISGAVAGLVPRIALGTSSRLDARSRRHATRVLLTSFSSRAPP